MKYRKIFASLLVLAMLASLFAACSGNYAPAPKQYSLTAPAAAAPQASSSAAGFSKERAMALGEAEYADGVEVAMDAAAPPESGGGVAGPSVTPVVDSRKIIKTVNLQLQTLEFDKGVSSIPEIAESFGGYVQDSYVQGRDMYNERGTRDANFTIRIPSEKLDAFVNSIGGTFHVTSKSQNSQDVTDTYFDSQARLDALTIQEQRLISMLEGATELEYMLQVEKELMNVRYEIESLTASLNRLDSQVSLSTVMIFLSEVVKLDPVENVPITFGERISRAFSESWENFFDFSQGFAVGFVHSLPFLLVLAVIVIVIVLIIKAISKKTAAKRAKMQNNMPVYAQQNAPVNQPVPPQYQQAPPVYPAPPQNNAAPKPEDKKD